MAEPTPTNAPPVPRGRHAPPLEVRLEAQRQRLFVAAATVFSRLGYADASAEAIAREAGMSKATFYEHFSNKEECILALGALASRRWLDALLQASREAGPGLERRHHAGVHAVLDSMGQDPELTQTAIVELMGSGPRGAEQRDKALTAFAEAMYQGSLQAAEREPGPAYPSLDDAYAIAGATFELVSRQLRTGHPKRMIDLEPLIDRLVLGLLSQPPR